MEFYKDKDMFVLIEEVERQRRQLQNNQRQIVYLSKKLKKTSNLVTLMGLAGVLLYLRRKNEKADDPK